MSPRIIQTIRALSLCLLLQPLLSHAADFDLSGTLGAANQNGSNPALVTDPLGVVPTTATGTIQLQLDTDSNTLDFQLSVEGIARTELRNFGPNATPIHLHLSGGGVPGNFGPIAIDLTLGATLADYTDTDTASGGFTLSRNNVSILLEDQGGVRLGMHPGNDLIVDSLLSGNMFVAVHTTNDIFVNNTGPAPGFPFVEIRGNIAPVPEPETYAMFLVGIGILGAVARRRAGISR